MADFATPLLNRHPRPLDRPDGLVATGYEGGRSSFRVCTVVTSSGDALSLISFVLTDWILGQPF